MLVQNLRSTFLLLTTLGMAVIGTTGCSGSSRPSTTAPSVSLSTELTATPAATSTETATVDPAVAAWFRALPRFQAWVGGIQSVATDISNQTAPNKQCAILAKSASNLKSSPKAPTAALEGSFRTAVSESLLATAACDQGDSVGLLGHLAKATNSLNQFAGLLSSDGGPTAASIPAQSASPEVQLTLWYAMNKDYLVNDFSKLMSSTAQAALLSVAGIGTTRPDCAALGATTKWFAGHMPPETAFHTSETWTAATSHLRQALTQCNSGDNQGLPVTIGSVMDDFSTLPSSIQSDIG